MSTPQRQLPSSSPPLEPSASNKNKGAPCLDMVLECDQDASMNDSFSTLGLHSIFSEDEIRSLEQQQQQQQKKKKQQQQHALSEKIVEEDDNKNDEDQSEAAGMDLRTLLQRGNQIKSGGCGDRQHRGNRWLESAGKSISFRNLGYEAFAAEDRPSHLPLRVSYGCEETVSHALELTDSPSSSSFARSASHGDLFAYYGKTTLEPPKPQPLRRGDRWASDGGRIVMSQSCRNLGVSTTATRDSGIRATAKAFDALTHRNSVTIIPNKSSPDKRKPMLTFGKSLSARNLNDMHPSYLSPSGCKPNSCRRLAVGERSKSVRHIMGTAGSSHAPPASAVMRQQSAGSLVQMPPAAASFNGRKFVSYSRSLSCRDFSDCNPQSTTTAASSTPQSPGASRLLATTTTTTTVATATTKTPESLGASRWLASAGTPAKASVLTPPTREVTAHRRTTGSPHQQPKVPFSLEDDDDDNDDDDSSNNKPPSNTSSSKATTTRKGSLSNYLKKKSQDDSPKLPPATTATRRQTVPTSSQASPRGRRGVMAKSMSARHVIVASGRGNQIRSLGKSLSARYLAAGEEESLPTLSTFSTMKSPATPRSKLSRCSEEDSLPTLLTVSTISTNPSKESPSTPAVKSKLEQSLSELDSLPGLSPISRSPSMPRTSRLAASLSAIDLKSKDDLESLPRLSPIIPCASKAPTTAARSFWKPSTSALHAISPPLATCEEDEAEDQSRTTSEPPNTKPSAKQPSSDSKKDTPVFSTEEILKEIGSILDMPMAGKKSDALAPIQEADDKGKPAGRPSLASSRRAQSCRHLSSTTEASQKLLKASSGHFKTPPKSSRQGMKREGSKRKLLSSSSSSKQGGSSRNLTKSSREKSDMPPEKQRSSRNLLQKSARKQKSSRKLMASGGEEKTEVKPGTSRSALKKEGSKRGLLPSSSTHLSSDSNRRCSSRATTRESRANSPSCVALYSPGKKEEEEKEERPSTSPKPDARRTAPSKKSSMGSHSSGGSSNKRLSTSSCLKSSNHSDNNSQCSTLRESTFNSSFRERCNRFQCTWSGEQQLGEVPSSERTE